MAEVFVWSIEEGWDMILAVLHLSTACWAGVLVDL